MLRIATLLLVLVTGSAFAAPVPKEKPKEVDPMLGKWKVEEMLVAGRTTDPDNKKQITLSHMGKPGVFHDFKGIFELDGDSLIVVFALDPKAARPIAAKSGPTVAYLKLQRI